jgi:hypothetical protein
LPLALESRNVYLDINLWSFKTVSETQQNYTSEQTAQLLSLYEQLGTDGIDEIAEQMNKPVRSIRSKLVKEGVYVPAQKQDNKKNGPSKKELLNTLETIVGFDTTGFSGSTKQVLADLIVYLDKTHTK